MCRQWIRKFNEFLGDRKRMKVCRGNKVYNMLWKIEVPVGGNNLAETLDSTSNESLSCSVVSDSL